MGTNKACNSNGNNLKATLFLNDSQFYQVSNKVNKTNNSSLSIYLCQSLSKGSKVLNWRHKVLSHVSLWAPYSLFIIIIINCLGHHFEILFP